MPKSNLERRSYTCEVRAETEERGNVIVGRPIVYGAPTDIGGMFQEIIESGALDGADLRDVRFLVNHDTSKIPLARSRNNNANSTMQLRLVPEGMDISALVDVENNSDARALHSAVQRGDISGMSFLFAIREQKWEGLDTDYPTRRILKISKVVEVSAVTFPAYEATEIHARGGNDMLDSMKRELESARAEARASLDSEELELLKLKALALYQ